MSTRIEQDKYLKLDIAFAKCQRANHSNTNRELKKTVMFCARHFFCSQVFKTKPNVLNSDVLNSDCKYCFDCFLFAGGDKLGSLDDVEFKAVKCDIPKH